MLSNWLASLRQLTYPAELRIPPPDWPPDLRVQFERLAERLQSPATPAGDGPVLSGVHGRELADVATGLWRLRRAMLQPNSDRPPEELRRPYRHFESVWDVLIQGGLEIIDHTNQNYDTGMSLRVLAFQPTPGLARERIVETVKPTVYFQGQPLQIGEVFVATPPEASPAPD